MSKDPFSPAACGVSATPRSCVHCPRPHPPLSPERHRTSPTRQPSHHHRTQPLRPTVCHCSPVRFSQKKLTPRSDSCMHSTDVMLSYVSAQLMLLANRRSAPSSAASCPVLRVGRCRDSLLQSRASDGGTCPPPRYGPSTTSEDCPPTRCFPTLPLRWQGPTVTFCPERAVCHGHPCRPPFRGKGRSDCGELFCPRLTLPS